MSSCKECNKKESVDYQQKNRRNVKFITQTRAAEIRRRCKHQGLPYDPDLTKLLRELWDEQDGKCAYTGLDMNIDGDYKTDPLFMTVDKVTPSLGYVKGNIKLCCSIVNRMKQNLDIPELKKYCQLILENN